MRRVCSRYAPVGVSLSSRAAVALVGGAGGNGCGSIVGCYSSPFQQSQRRSFVTTRLLWSSAPQPPVTPAESSSTSVAPLPDVSSQDKTAEQLAEEALAEKLRALSPEDQQLIMNALENPDSQKPSRLGGGGIGTKDGDMVAAFTCGKCDFRMVKRFSKHAYTKGIVIVECPNCEVRHLLADNLGWFVDESRNIEDILREKGESFVRIGSDLQVEPPSQ